MAAYLPDTWRGRRVDVEFERQDGGGFEGILVEDNEGGVRLEIVEEAGPRTLFVPWSAVRYAELLDTPTR